MSLINPADSIERQNEKLLQIAQSLMRRVEQKNEQSGLAYQQFERAALLETQVRERTRALERTLDLLQDSNARLEVANLETETARANLTEAIETINEGFALFDTEDRLVLSNSRFCRDLLDIEERLVAGLPFQDYVSLISSSRFLALPEKQQPQEWAQKRMQRHGDEHVVFNVRLLWDRWLQVSEHRTSRGGTVILQTDVTDIIRLERQERDKMRDQQAKMLQATLDHLNQGVCIFDHNQILVGWNKKMDGMLAPPRRRAAIGMEFSTLLDRLRDDLVFHDGFDAEHLSKWANHSIRRRPMAFEVSRGGTQIFNVFAQEMPDGGFVISFTDVTAERETARALYEMNEFLERRVQDRTQELGVALAEAERANASKSRFVAAASHDLLQPLSAAKLFISSLPDKVENPEALEVIAKTETALMGAEQIIEALLDISKLDAGKAVFKVQPLSLSRIFAPLRDELSPLADKKGIELRIVDCDLSVRSDPGYLRRIVQNLVSNAIRYTSQGRVLVGVRRVGERAKIEVWDTGRGIPESEQRTIFQEFHRLDATNSEAGLGLGLAIVERACKGLEHELNLWSAPGVGSCFSLMVPVNDAKTERAQPEEAPQSRDAKNLHGLLFMLVENDPQLASAMSMMIEGHGASVIHANSAEEATALLHEIELIPDAMLLDYHLGSGRTGTEFYESLSADYRDVPTAIVSANRSKELKDTCKRLSLRLLEKPISKESLRGFLSQIPTARHVEF
ncbi:signal transduction histidine kinase [Litoreibacter halocynthiae]|uniref:histidine kinase n=1 Tax=Litoreibacter halocynthiae TaxID=1242689 RepID=A0A4V3EWL9_9RHOB|nr:PAS-domain containing protein [Litoreibacter halocynthiae]TDT77365.1 signal transduction histidine kinase [Litoreibacter halocynthiae]